MELRQFKYFVAIVDSGSLSRAAQNLYIAQSALSKQISDLEGELGTQLLERTRSGVRVTETGQVFYEYSQAILKQVDDVKAAVKSTASHIVGQVAVAIPQSVSNALALPLNIAARQKLPGITLNLNEELTGNLIDQLQQGRVDFMLFTDNVSTAGFKVRPIVQEELFLISATNNPPVPPGAELTLVNAVDLPLLLSSREHDHCLRSLVEIQAANEGVAIKNVVAEINSVHILKSAVLAGLGHTIFPKAPVQVEINQGSLQATRIGGQGLFRNLVICTSKSIPMTNPKRAVLGLILEVIHGLCESGAWPGAKALFEHDAKASLLVEGTGFLG